MKRLFVNILAVSTACLASAQYKFTELPVRPGLAFQRMVAISKHGTYAIGLSLDSSSQSHYLLYGPDFTQIPQDLNTSAGPLGPATGGKVWNGGFVAVNDKGHCVAYQNINPNNIYDASANIFFYNHSTPHSTRWFPLPAQRLRRATMQISTM